MNIPKNERAELAVIGKLLLSGESVHDKLPEVMGIVSGDDFCTYWEKINLRDVYVKIVELYAQGKEIDVVSMGSILSVEEFVKLSMLETSSADLRQSCKYVKDASMLRNRMSIASKIIAMCERGDSVTDVDRLFNDMQVKDSGYDLHAQVNGFSEYEEYLRGFKGDLLGISTGIPELDDMTWGLQKNHVWVVGGYRGSGKSFFGVNVVDSVLRSRKKALVFNLEMSNNEFMHRLISLRCRLHSKLTYKEELEESVRVKKEEVLTNWGNKDLIMRDDLNHIDEIESFIALTKLTGGVDVVLIDFVQLVRTKADNIYERMSEVATRLQSVAKKYGMAIILLSQLNNETAKAGASVDVDGFKGAGELSQVANVAIKIIRARDFDGKLTEMFKLEVVKVRHNFGGDIFKKIVFPGGKIEGTYDAEEDAKEKAIKTTKSNEKEVFDD